MAKAGYVENYRTVYDSLGVPQGGIVSPILSNIYLDKFDKYMDMLRLEYETPRGKRTTTVSPEYQRITRNLRKLETEYESDSSPQLLKKIREIRLLRSKMPSRIGIGVRINYVRYADD